MKLNHYTLSQLLTAYSRDHLIRISVEHAGAPDQYNIELDHEKSVQVREVGYRLGELLSPSQEEVVAKRLYKMRFVDRDPTSTDQVSIFEASIRDTKVTVIVQDPKITNSVPETSPCVSLDLSKKVEELSDVDSPKPGFTTSPYMSLDVSTKVDPQPAANEDLHDKPASYRLERIVDQYSSPFVSTYNLRFDFSLVKDVGLEKCGFICVPDLGVIRELILEHKASASDELREVLSDIEQLVFVFDVVGEPTFIATKGRATVRVIAERAVRIRPAALVKEITTDQKAEGSSAHRPEPSLKETFISWLRKFFRKEFPCKS